MGFDDELEELMGVATKTELGSKMTKTIKVSLKKSFKVGGLGLETSMKAPLLPDQQTLGQSRQDLKQLASDPSR